MKTLHSEISNPTSPELFEFTHGLDVDKLMYMQEIRVQTAWLRALKESHLLNSKEHDVLLNSIQTAMQMMSAGSFPWKLEEEDIHMNIERFVCDRVGELGKTLQLGRSRNDLVATTLRLYLSDVITEMQGLTSDLGSKIKNKAQEWMDILVPGMTHLQFGQPVRLGHLLSAHGFALSRDKLRLQDSQRECLAHCPLGAAAFAGTHLAIDLHSLAKDLGFSAPLAHSYDAVGDRDFILDTLNSFSILAVHLSRLAEEIIYWGATPVALLTLPNEFSTGSSIMPNKRNPDVPELIRAKMCQVISRANEASLIVKSVVPSYGTDFHELKRTLNYSYCQLSASFRIFSPFISKLQCNRDAANHLINKGHVLATDLANQLSQQGHAFRDAYKTTASMIHEANNRTLQIHELANEKLDVNLSFFDSAEARNNIGGTASESAHKALEQLQF